MKKAGARKALEFFEDNYIMICSLESKDEEGCANKCLDMLKKYVKNIDKELDDSTKKVNLKEI